MMLTSYPDEEAVLSAIVAGASGYLLKQMRARDLVAALEAVGRGESLLDPAVTEKVLERVRRIATTPYDDELAQLTQQERRILLLVAEGKTNKEIAAEVFLSDKTVKNYVSSILSKLNLQRRAQAAAYVAKHKGESGYYCVAAHGDRGARAVPTLPRTRTAKNSCQRREDEHRDSRPWPRVGAAPTRTSAQDRPACAERVRTDSRRVRPRARGLRATGRPRSLSAGGRDGGTPRRSKRS